MKPVTIAGCLMWTFALVAAEGTAFASGILDDLLDPDIPVEMDVKLGRATAQEVARDPRIRLLSPKQYPEAYSHLRRIMGHILASDAIQYRESFAYGQARIIHDDKTLNAFATAGGYIFVYTGLIKYLDAEDHLAGVLGHEVAHAERRHVSHQLEERMSTSRKLLLLQLLTGAKWTDSDLIQIARELRNLKYSREDEAEADRYSVRYLAGSPYACDGARGFFAKIRDEGKTRMPEWLSSHPEPDDRINTIEAQARELDCNTQLVDSTTYGAFKAALP